MPCLIDGSVKVWDSLAVLEYLAERHARLWPAEAAEREPESIPQFDLAE